VRCQLQILSHTDPNTTWHALKYYKLSNFTLCDWLHITNVWLAYELVLIVRYKTVNNTIRCDLSIIKYYFCKQSFCLLFLFVGNFSALLHHFSCSSFECYWLQSGTVRFNFSSVIPNTVCLLSYQSCDIVVASWQHKDSHCNTLIKFPLKIQRQSSSFLYRLQFNRLLSFLTHACLILCFFFCHHSSPLFFFPSSVLILVCV